MKERPILFSAPMVRAILEGRKSQTRRAVKSVFHAPPPIDAECIRDRDGLPSRLPGPRNWELCPYGQPGDRLWVRETFFAPFQFSTPKGAWKRRGQASVRYCADDAFVWRPITREQYDKKLKAGKHPGIHMPRWASRITLEVTGVRVERLQDISEADAVAEGVESDFASPEYAAQYGALCGRRSRYGYAKLWNQINGPGSWDANPWVWVVEFKRIEATP